MVGSNLAGTGPILHGRRQHALSRAGWSLVPVVPATAQEKDPERSHDDDSDHDVRGGGFFPVRPESTREYEEGYDHEEAATRRSDDPIPCLIMMDGLAFGNEARPPLGCSAYRTDANPQPGEACNPGRGSGSLVARLSPASGRVRCRRGRERKHLGSGPRSRLASRRRCLAFPRPIMHGREQLRGSPGRSRVSPWHAVKHGTMALCARSA